MMNIKIRKQQSEQQAAQYTSTGTYDMIETMYYIAKLVPVE
jgi:hypothetical protein